MDQKANIDHTHNGSDIVAGKIKAEFIDEAICRDSELSDAIAALKNGGDQTQRCSAYGHPCQRDIKSG